MIDNLDRWKTTETVNWEELISIRLLHIQLISPLNQLDGCDRHIYRKSTEERNQILSSAEKKNQFMWDGIPFMWQMITHILTISVGIKPSLWCNN